ncbi:MAG: hypothetical protein AAF225_10600 [Pseudomonadota bacterium]
MPTTIYNIAQLADDVYNANSEAPFNRVHYQNNPTTDFSGAIYDVPGFRVVSFAGTDSLRDAVVSDLQLATGWLPEQEKDARKLLFRAYEGGRPILMTGHSLGGALCQILGYEDVPFISFNAPPMATNMAASWASTGARAMATAAAAVAGGGLLGVVAYIASTKTRQAAIGNVKPETGINFRLPYDPVSSSYWGGGHVGSVIEIPAPSWTVNRHSMSALLKSLSPEGDASDMGAAALN